MTTFTGFGTLAGAALRRERVRLALWVGALVVLMAASSAQMAATYQTPAERAAAARLLATNPALLTCLRLSLSASTVSTRQREGLVLGVVHALRSGRLDLVGRRHHP
jgi:hypothetical protein